MDGGLGRRELLAVGSLGITSSLLPSGVAAASVGGVVAAAPSAPTIASAEPAGYLLSQPQDGTSTGAIEVTWGEVGGATSYAVSTRTPSGSGDYLLAGTTSATTLTVTGLSESATYDVVVEASNAVGASSPSAPATAVGTVVATGGTVTTFVGDGANGTSGTRYVVHAFTTVGASSLTLNRSRALEYLVVGGGGGGGGLTGRNMCAGGGGGGGVVVGDRASAGTAVGEPLAIVVGDGGAGGPDVVPDPLVSPGADGYARGGASSSFDGVTALGGGAGGSAPFSGSAAAGDAAALPAPNAVSTAARATGGGGLGQSTAQSGASGSASKGGDGTANINSVSSQFGGGGGGAGGDGTATTDATTSGRGGVGVASRIAGTRVEYGSGGGGGKRQDGSGGPGGALSGLVSAGGAGGRDAAGSAGVDGRGGGGGGAGRDSGTPVVGNAVGGRGGSGVVIVRYAVPA